MGVGGIFPRALALWMEIEPVKPLLLSPRNDKFGVTFKYEMFPNNMGKTAARDIKFRSVPIPLAGYNSGSDRQFVDFNQKILLGKVPSAADVPVNNPFPKVLPPQTASTVPFIYIGQEPQIFPKVQWASYFIGRIDYCDEFQVGHWLKFCFFVANSRGELWNCKEGNEEDTNAEIPPKDGKCVLP